VSVYVCVREMEYFINMDFFKTWNKTLILKLRSMEHLWMAHYELVCHMVLICSLFPAAKLHCDTVKYTLNTFLMLLKQVSCFHCLKEVRQLQAWGESKGMDDPQESLW